MTPSPISLRPWQLQPLTRTRSRIRLAQTRPQLEGNDVLAITGGSLSIVNSVSFVSGLTVNGGAILFGMNSVVTGAYSQREPCRAARVA
jgi:hypothetical protein